jgi:hypothetical protein
MTQLFSRPLHAASMTAALLLVTGCGPAKFQFESVSQNATANSCHPVVGSVQPREASDLRWKWSTSSAPEYNQNMATPMVADVNGDGVSDFVFSTFKGNAYTANGILRVVSGIDGTEIWSTAGRAASEQPLGSAAPAIYDLDRDGRPEILIAGAKALLVYDHAGRLIDRFTLDESVSHLSRVAVADLDFDGVYEVLIGMTSSAWLYRYDVHAHSLSPALLSNVLGMMDVAPDSPGLEVITSTAIYSSQLRKLNNLELVSPGSSAMQVAFGNFDGDSDTELVVTQESPVSVSLIKGRTGKRLQSWTESEADRAACLARRGSDSVKVGAPNVGDLDGDGTPDLTFAGACSFRALKSDTTGLHELWQVETRDFSSSVTGSSIFDFNGDGRVEALYNDELFFRILDGRTGNVLFQIANDNGTLFENPVVVSLKPGEPASIVLSANSYTGYTQAADRQRQEAADENITNVTGIRVIQGADNLWMPTRTLWNQFDYIVTNVLDDLEVPSALQDFVGKSNRTRANVPAIVHRCE